MRTIPIEQYDAEIIAGHVRDKNAPINPMRFRAIDDSPTLADHLRYRKPGVELQPFRKHTYREQTFKPATSEVGGRLDRSLRRLTPQHGSASLTTGEAPSTQH